MKELFQSHSAQEGIRAVDNGVSTTVTIDRKVDDLAGFGSAWLSNALFRMRGLKDGVSVDGKTSSTETSITIKGRDRQQVVEELAGLIDAKMTPAPTEHEYAAPELGQ